MDLTPTLSVIIGNGEYPAIIKDLKRRLPLASVDEKVDNFFYRINSKRYVGTFYADSAVFLKTGVKVVDLEAAISLSFTSDGDKFIILTSGDVVNFSLDNRNAADHLRYILENSNS